jgi:hypothetical protein
VEAKGKKEMERGICVRGREREREREKERERERQRRRETGRESRGN